MLGQFLGDCRAYSPACPGNQGDFSLQINTHGKSPEKNMN
jgi:hypothetical protein